MMEHERRFLRFTRAYRAEHWLLVLVFTTLAITGLVQKFAQNEISFALINALGGIEHVRIIHRIAATTLILETIYHIGRIGYNLIVRHFKPDLMLGLDDLRNIVRAIQYNLGRREQRPQQGRYTFEEKFEYIALVWGTIVMIVTGFVLWKPIAVTETLPGEFVPAAKAVHSGEALLAVLAIIVWHMYHVHIRRFNKSMFTGSLSEEEMREEHPLELAERAEESEAAPRRDRWYGWRRRLFLGVYGGVAVVAVLLLAIFVTSQHTAIETQPPPVEEVHAFAPALAPTTVPASFDSPMTSWDDGVGALLEVKCAFCHGGTTPLSNLDLSSYDTALLGGTTLPAITPSDPENSGVIMHLVTTDHPVEFTPDELVKLTLWVQNGAPRQ
ncbi:MAG: cytochrome b/b6 domain-containing protein [Anaerolineae bacterium]